MPIQVILFGQLADIAGVNHLDVEASDTASLQQAIVDHYPALSKATYRIAVNKQLVTDNMEITEGSIVALLPPFSGG